MIHFCKQNFKSLRLSLLFILFFSGCLVTTEAKIRAQQAVLPAAHETVLTPDIGLIITTNTAITPGCLLNVAVKDEPALSGEFIVDNDGAIHFVLADDEAKHKEQWSVTVAAKTAAEAEGLVLQSLKVYLRRPEVHVTLVSVPHLHVELSGTGCKYASLDLSLNAHLSDILVACKTNADFSHILILHRQSALEGLEPTGSTPQTLPANNQSANQSANQAPAKRSLTVDFRGYQQGENTDDPKLQDGDKIYIQLRDKSVEKPEYVLRTVRVVGEVGREVDLPLAPDMTLRDALARAGGLKDTADKNKIRLHRGESGKDFDLKAAGIMAGEPGMNLTLEPGDYIVVGKVDLSMRWGIDGEVVSRNVFPFTPGEKITVSRAIARVGGLTKKADPHKGVLRKGYLINPTQSHDILFDLDAIMKKKQTDWTVDAGDVVVMLPRPHRPTIWQQLLPLALHLIPLPL